MNCNRRTLALAAAGLVTFPLLLSADEQKLNPLSAALSSTTISGYVDTSAHWNLGTGNSSVGLAAFQGPGKSDGFNLNVVQLTIAKPLDEAEWSSGYRADLWFGPDANSLNTRSVFASGSQAQNGDLAIRQAYVALRMPVGNGLDWKVGVFDTIIGYESLEAGNNPNYTRSYGHFIEPTTHTGALASYRINDIVSVSAGIANTIGPAINERAHGPNAATDSDAPVMAESYKSYMGSIALTAPDSFGWAKGSTIYGGVINGFNSGIIGEQTSWYVGATIATPLAGLKVGACFDQIIAHDFEAGADSVWVAGAYASYQATEKLSVHLRGEYLDGARHQTDGNDFRLYELTATVQYDLWKNVISRLEFRWDHADASAEPFGGRTGSGSPPWEESEDAVGARNGFEDYHEGSVLIEDLIAGVGGSLPSPLSHEADDAFLIALNLIYKF